MNPRDDRNLPRKALEARLAGLQKHAFELYEAASARAEATPALADEAYADAERATAPLIAEAKALNDERVRRLRAQARLFRRLAIAIAIIGVAATCWLLLR